MPVQVVYRSRDGEGTTSAHSERVLLANHWLFAPDDGVLVPRDRVLAVDVGTGTVEELTLPIGTTETTSDGEMGTSQLGGGKLGGGD